MDENESKVLQCKKERMNAHGWPSVLTYLQLPQRDMESGNHAILSVLASPPIESRYLLSKFSQTN